jgi:hypothetical protein
MYSMIRSCESSAFWLHSLGKVVPFDWRALLTWKSLKIPWPHWPAVEASGVSGVGMGMSNVK